MKTFFAEIIRKREAGGIVVLQGFVLKATSLDGAKRQAQDVRRQIGGVSVRYVRQISAAQAAEIVRLDMAVA